MQDALIGIKASHQVLKKLVEDINLTGGLVPDPENPTLMVLAEDEEWCDLAITTENAFFQCRELETLLSSAGSPLSKEQECPELITKKPEGSEETKTTAVDPIEKTTWAKAFKHNASHGYATALKYALDPTFQVKVIYTTETGDPQWAICAAHDPEFWMDAKPTKAEAINLCTEMGWKISYITK